MSRYIAPPHTAFNVQVCCTHSSFDHGRQGVVSGRQVLAMFYVNASTGEGDRQTDKQRQRETETDRQRERRKKPVSASCDSKAELSV